MTLPDSLCFAGWELRVASRELRLRDRLQDVEPRVFDLLVHLIENHDRVVRHDELLEQVWGGATVSENVIARTVMKLRKAIGDKADDQSLVRTVHRVGYRFMGGAPVPRAPQQPLPRAAPTAPDLVVASPLLRLGLLPFENLTGDPDLAWIESGLTALVGQALETDVRISVLPTAAILNALASATGSGFLDESRSRTVERLLGLHCVVQTRVRRQAALYEIDYRALGSRGGQVHGQLVGAELTALGQALARHIEAQLFPNEEAAVPFQSEDTVANQTFARAMQAGSEERWQSAAKLLQVVLDIEPHSTVAAAEYLRVLATLFDPAAFALGERLLQQALNAGDMRLAATVHLLLGQAHLNIHGPREDASRHLDEALRLAAAHGAADWVLRIYFMQARQEQLKHNFDRARQLYDQASRGTKAAGNLIDLAKIMNNCAVMDAMTGNLLGARNWMEESLRLSKELMLDANIVASGGNLAIANAELGFMRLALEQCDAIAGRIGSIQETRMAAGVTLTLCRVYAELPELAKMDRVLEAMRLRGDGDSPTVPAYMGMAHGVRAVAAGDVQAACAAMRDALAIITGIGDTFMADQWLPLLLSAETDARQFDAAADTIQRLRTSPLFDDDDTLQGVVLRAQALELHARGDANAARMRLLEAANTLPIGRWSAMTRLDAAWLHIECGQLSTVRQLLRDIRPWLAEHPAGWLTQARLKAAQGLWAEAVALQQRYESSLPVPATGHRELLTRLYAEGLAGGAPAVPVAPRLPTQGAG